MSRLAFYRNRQWLILAGWMCMVTTGSAESDANTDTEGAHGEPIPLIYRHTGLSHGVPYALLYSIGLKESGMTISDRGFVPWPWTLNIKGMPARFDSKDAAMATLLSSLDQGIRNIDIGEAQINYYYNGTLFPSIEEAFDTETSLTVATQILHRELAYCEAHLDRQDWWCAIERYHSPGQSTAQRHRALVYAQGVRDIYDRLRR